jgi:hypothetical protein
MTTGAEPEFRCPGCGRTDRLHVYVLTAAHLTQDPDGNIQTEVYGGHEWDCTYTMWCDCGCCDAASSFSTRKP